MINGCEKLHGILKMNANFIYIKRGAEKSGLTTKDNINQCNYIKYV